VKDNVPSRNWRILRSFLPWIPTNRNTPLASHHPCSALWKKHCILSFVFARQLVRFLIWSVALSYRLP